MNSPKSLKPYKSLNLRVKGEKSNVETKKIFKKKKKMDAVVSERNLVITDSLTRIELRGSVEGGDRVLF